MSNSQNLSNPKQIAKLAKRLDSKRQLLLIKELVSTLNHDLLETMKLEAEQALIINQLDGIEDPEELDERPGRHFELKKIKHKYYAYLRWREDGHHKSEYLGPMPLLPGHTYTLIHTKDGNKKTLTPLGLEIEDERIYLKVQVLNPIRTIRSYPYPDCLKTIFNKKEWNIQKVASPSDQKEQTLDTSFFSPQEALTSPIQPKVQNMSKPGIKSDTLKSERAKSVEPVTTWESHSQEIQYLKSETRKEDILNLKVPNKLVPQVLATLKQWEDFSKSLQNTPHWTLVRQGSKVNLRTTKENETLIEYNRTLGSVTSPHTAPVLIERLRQITNAVSSSQLVSQDTKTQAIRFKTRLQGAPQENTTELLAYLLGLPSPKKLYRPLP
ncbi:MAG: hypothetical protein NHB32_09405 [Fischerella sp. CENA71]|nr:hypothetical protein [Fischerella sp. CENA71]